MAKRSKALTNAYRQYKIACELNQKRKKAKWLKEINRLKDD